jgi:predicted RNA-binding protein with PIN domain
MSLLIDGYNLLYAAGIVGSQRGARGLESSRLALLNFLVGSLDPAELATTTVVFDAAGAPPGLPATLSHAGLSVRFARDPGNADAMLEDLILANTSPRRLTVVSSDHRVQRAARRRRARAVDSDVWYSEVQLRKRGDDAAPRKNKRSGRSTTDATKDEEPKPGDERSLMNPAAALSASEVEYWLSRFDESAPDLLRAPQDDDSAIFPPGYAEDIDDA